MRARSTLTFLLLPGLLLPSLALAHPPKGAQHEPLTPADIQAPREQREAAPEKTARARDAWSDFSDFLDQRQALAMRELSALRLPEAERKAYLAKFQAKKLDFCVGFKDMDSLGSTQFISKSLPTWKTIWKMSAMNEHGQRTRFVQQLYALVEQCKYSRGAVYRAAFLLEYMYWNRMLDRTGMEVARALAYRDYFYELKFIDIARDKVAHARGEERPMRTKGNLFEAREMRLAFFLRFFGNLTTSFPPMRRRAYMAQIKTLDLRQGSMLMFGNDIIELLDHPEDLEVMVKFSGYLQQLQRDPSLMKTPHGGWAKLLELTGGDRAKALKLLGLLASLRGWVMEEVADALLKRGALKPEQLHAFYSGANAYFVMNQLSEASAHNGEDAYTLRYHFFYPQAYETTNWKGYHWYANAHLGCQLARQGMTKRSVKVATRRLAQAYEALTLNLAIPTKRAMGEEPRARAIIEGFEDIRINTEGGAYGWEQCKP